MVPDLRQAFNEAFTRAEYDAFLTDLNSKHPGAIEFRIAETPIFIPKAFGRKIIDACESITDLITDPDFKKITESGIPKDENVPGENGLPQMIAFDFGICINAAGELERVAVDHRLGAGDLNLPQQFDRLRPRVALAHLPV